MILAAGLSPAWQQIFAIEKLGLGAVNRARQVWSGASGKVVNVAAALEALEAGSARLLSLAGGATGRAMIQDCQTRGLQGRWVPASSPTRLCTTVVELAVPRATELVENAAPIAPAELAAFRDAYAEEARRADVAVLIGSLPIGTPTALYRDLLSATPSRTILDARGPELLSALERRPFLVKPNREELAATLDRPLTAESDVGGAMQELRRRGAQWVVVTHGKEAVWAAGPEGVFRFQPPEITAISPIGSGDSLAAGIAWSLASGRDVPEAIRVGIGCAVDNAAALLTARLDRRRVAGYRDTVGVERIG